jgi:hypothetical protein
MPGTTIVSLLLLLILYTPFLSCTGSETPGGEKTKPGSSPREADQTTPAETAALMPVPFQDPDDETWGYRDPAGKVLIPTRYILAEPFSRGGIAAVADKQGWTYIDTRGRVVIRPLLVDNGPDPFQEGLARFRHGTKIGFFRPIGYGCHTGAL